MKDRARWNVPVAVLLVLPAVLFLSANVLKHELGMNLLSDALGPFAAPRGALEAIVTALIVVGPLAAFLLALTPIVRLRLNRSNATVVATVSVRLWWTHLGIALVALGLLVVLGGYVVVENSACWFGGATAC